MLGLPPLCLRRCRKKVCDIDFTSPAGRLAKISRAPEIEPEVQDTGVPAYVSQDHANALSREAVKRLFETVAESDPKAIVLSTMNDHHDPFLPPPISEELPKLMDTLYDEGASKLSCEELLLRCRAVITDVCAATNDQVEKVEELTRDQSSSYVWYKFRRGRITASNMKFVCRGNIAKPAISTINKICYIQKFYSAAVERRKKLEAAGRKKYFFVQKIVHEDLSVKECGLFLRSDRAYIGASPDGVVSCTCCEGTGGLEIKAPDLKNLYSAFDKDGNLDRDHQYFYQVQTQMYVCDLSYCDFFVYHPKKHVLKRVFPNKECFQEIIDKSHMYFLYVILPELISKHFTRNRPPLALMNSNSSKEQSNIICYCRQPRRNPIVFCSGQTAPSPNFIADVLTWLDQGSSGCVRSAGNRPPLNHFETVVPRHGTLCSNVIPLNDCFLPQI